MDEEWARSIMAMDEDQHGEKYDDYRAAVRQYST
jgi:hypothetical protein